MCANQASLNQTCIVAVPSRSLGQQPFAVSSGLNGLTADQIRGHVKATFGDDYALGGVASLKEIGLDQFPVNATHKIVKARVQRIVMDFLDSKQP